MNRTQERIVTFWSEFSKHKDSLARKGMKYTTQWLQKHIAAIDSRLMWEVVPWTPGKTELAFTCEYQFELKPLIEHILENAPTLDDWIFSGVRPPVPMRDVPRVFRSRTGKSIPECKVSLFSTPTNFVNILFSATPSVRRDVTSDDLLVLSEIILGEERLAVWGGEVDFDNDGSFSFDPASVVSQREISLEAFQSAFDAACKSILSETTPEKYYYEEQQPEIGALFDFTSEDQSLERYTYNTRQPRITEATLEYRFWSRRFSRLDEEFCFISIEPTDRNNEDVTHRVRLEELIDGELRAARLGCVFGGGMGPGKLFIDLVLADVDESVVRIKRLLAAEKLKWAQLRLYDQTYANGFIPLL